MAAVWIAWRQQSGRRASERSMGSVSSITFMQEPDDYQPTEASVLKAGRGYGVGRPAFTLMDGIKEELFQIEVERKQGQISQAEYLEAKAGLDQTLARVLKREAQQA